MSVCSMVCPWVLSYLQVSKRRKFVIHAYTDITLEESHISITGSSLYFKLLSMRNCLNASFWSRKNDLVYEIPSVLDRWNWALYVSLVRSILRIKSRFWEELKWFLPFLISNINFLAYSLFPSKLFIRHIESQQGNKTHWFLPQKLN